MLVQRGLRVAEPSVTVGNAGAPSFAPRDFPRTVERWRHAGFAPDTCVLCLYLGNDFADAFTERREMVDGFNFAEPIARAVRGSWRARLALHSYAWFHFETFLRVHLPQYGLDLPFAAAAAELAQSQRDLPPLAECHAGIFMDARSRLRCCSVSCNARSMTCGTPPWHARRRGSWWLSCRRPGTCRGSTTHTSLFMVGRRRTRAASCGSGWDRRYRPSASPSSTAADAVRRRRRRGQLPAAGPPSLDCGSPARRCRSR